ncbi:CsbD family protein [Lactococcus garvieae]|uniref:CsbD family protein n=1 Tax=Lactococcus garvieae TaxID=1363 RepID=UPI002551C5C3|nr:CsbD family protein [Lactococcus garvieae]
MSETGFTDKIKGKAQEVTGDATGDKEKKAEGILNQVAGKVKETASGIKEKTEDIVEDVKEKIK